MLQSAAWNAEQPLRHPVISTSRHQSYTTLSPYSSTHPHVCLLCRPCYVVSTFPTLQIKGALLTWLQRDCTAESPALPPFLRNKLAQAIVAVVKREYPAVWPGFFRELVAAAGSGPGLADMFARIMVAVDEDVISLDIPRWAFLCCFPSWRLFVCWWCG
jgi:hypothetical protein